MYDTDDEANQKIAGSVVFHGDEPMYVAEIHRGVVTAYSLPLGEKTVAQKIPLKDGQWRFNRIRLGYVNLDPHAVFFARRPVRRSRQGICDDNTVSFFSSDGNDTRGVHINNVIREKGFVRCLLNQYPTSREALGLVKIRKDRCSVAFNRGFSYERYDFDLLFLRHAGERIGVSHDGERFVVGDEFRHLKESLTEIGVTLK